MADLKISALTAATTPLAGTEVLPIVQGGVTTKVAVSDLTAGRAVTASSVNKVAITTPATASTLTIADGKTLAVNDNATLGTGGLTLGNSGGFTAAASKVLTASNSLTLAGTDATTHTFPTTSATIARTDAAQTFVGVQSFNDVLSSHKTSGALVTNATFDIPCSNTVNKSGLLFLRESSVTAAWALIGYSMDGVVAIIAQSGSLYTVTAATPNRINVYISINNMQIQNSCADTRVIDIALIGVLSS